MAAERKSDESTPNEPRWPDSLSRVGAIRFARRYSNFNGAVHFFRDLVGLPLYETFEGSYGNNGAIFGMPTPALTFEVVEAVGPLVVDPHESLCLYFPNESAMHDAIARLETAGIMPASDQHPYWQATGAITYLDPDGRQLVFAPFVYGKNEPEASFADGKHGFPGSEDGGHS